ncbi:MAG: M28 family peptidase, partial [bacterium]
HPKESSNDNASGSAAMLDIARTLKELIGRGRLPHPKRSFRFLWVPEWYGTMAYIDAHPELKGPALGGKFLANINLDMVGEHLELIHSKLILTRTPYSIPSAVNDVVENMAQMVDGMHIRTPRGSLSAFNYRVTPYSGGSDHMMFIERKIPGVMFGHSPDYTHHTSEDTPDKVDPVEIERCEILAAGTMWYLANLQGAQAEELVYLVGANALKRLGLAAGRAHRKITEASDEALPLVLSEAENMLQHVGQWEMATVSSILNFNNSEPAKNLVVWMNKQLSRQHASLSEQLRSYATSRGLTDGEPLVKREKPDLRIPVRKTRGPIDFDLPERRLSPEQAAWYKSRDFTLDGNTRFELVNFVDGQRTVSDIRDALSAEFGPVKTSVISRYLEDLVRVGVMAWK